MDVDHLALAKICSHRHTDSNVSTEHDYTLQVHTQGMVHSFDIIIEVDP